MEVFEAVVTEVLPKVAGVRVRFRDLVPSGFGMNDYALVLNARMSTTGGASLWLPEKGEHGLVVKLTGGVYVWMGSLPFLDQNQIDPTPNIAYLRHPSGVTAQIRDNGDFEILHPSGFRFTVSTDGAAMPELQHSARVDTHGGEVPVMTISHPSGGSATMDKDGNVTVVGESEITFRAPLITLDGVVNCTGLLYVQAGFATGAVGGGNTGMIPGDLKMAGSVYANVDGVFGPTKLPFLQHGHLIMNVGYTGHPFLR